MNMYDFTFFAVGVASVLVSITLIALFIWGIMVMKRLNRLFDTLEAISKSGLETTQAIHGFAEKTTEQLSMAIKTMVSIQGAKEIVGAIGEQFKKNKNEKESHHGTTK
ncbi:MAG TPA: hypothetical protein VGE59_02640 [Patescibacteria group bacterium]